MSAEKQDSNPVGSSAQPRPGGEDRLLGGASVPPDGAQFRDWCGRGQGRASRGQRVMLRACEGAKVGKTIVQRGAHTSPSTRRFICGLIPFNERQERAAFIRSSSSHGPAILSGLAPLLSFAVGYLLPIKQILQFGGN